MDETPQSALTTEPRSAEALSVRRLFTRPGVHPFDTVEWELRDARIGYRRSSSATSSSPPRGRRTRRTSSPRSTSAASSTRRRASARYADDRPRGGHDRRLGPRARLLRVRRGRRRLRGRAHLRPAPPDGGVQLARVVQRGLRGAAAVQSACFILSVDDTMESILDWNTREGKIFRGGSGLGHQPVEHPRLDGAAEQGRHGVRPGLLHARRRRLGGHDQVRRQDAPRGQDGRAGRRPSRHPRVHLVQGQGGGQGRRAARRRVRHVDRRRRLPLDPVPERQQLRPAHGRVHARRRAGPGLAPDRPRRAASRSATDSGARAHARDRRGRVALRRSGRAVRHDDQPVAHVAELGAHQRVEPVLPGRRARAHDQGPDADRRARRARRGWRGHRASTRTERPRDDARATASSRRSPVAFMRNGVKPIVRLRFANGARAALHAQPPALDAQPRLRRSGGADGATTR